MALVIKDAVKRNIRARIGLLAPTGGGKTYTGLKFLFSMVELGMAKKIGVIDTEHESASKYIGDPFPSFRVIELHDDFSPEIYVEALQLLADDGCDAVLVDSLTHAWAGKGGALEIKDKTGRQKGFNDYTAWGPVTAMHNRLIEKMLSYPGHLIGTMRVKMDHVVEKDEKTGKNTVRKIGLQPVQRDGMEYEFDLVGDLDTDHVFTVSKTRCSALDGYSERKPGKDVILKLRAWLEGGTAATDRATVPTSTPASTGNPPPEASPASTPESLAPGFAAKIRAAASVAALGDLVTEIRPHVESGAITPAQRDELVALYGEREAQLQPQTTTPAATVPAQTFARFAEEIRAAKDERGLLEIAVRVGKAVEVGQVTAVERSKLIEIYGERESALRKAA